jgi:site-specific DNA-methyltransferase (adenine-specific)
MRNNIPDNFVDLTVTSPPYDNLRTYKGFVFDYKSMLKELYRITKDGGVVVWVVNDATIKGSETLTSFKQAIYAKEECGFNVHDTMIYEKINYIPLTHNRYEQCFEYMFVFSKGKPKTFNPIMIDCKTKGNNTDKRTFYQTNKQDKPTIGHNNVCVKNQKQNKNIWELSTNSGYKGHPAPFPEQLAKDHILSWSNENDIVFDPMCGSGTTCKEAYLLHRNFIGVDMSEEYINTICIPRLKQYGWNKVNNVSKQNFI